VDVLVYRGTLSTEEDLVAHLENKQIQDPTLQISSVQASDHPSTDANDSVHDVPSEASLDNVQCAVWNQNILSYFNLC
jgi:translation initiation factor IF-2